MRISSSSHGHDVLVDKVTAHQNTTVTNTGTVSELSTLFTQQQKQSDQTELENTTKNKKQLKHVVDSLNEFMEVQYRNSKFVLHEDLHKYYVQVVDAKTEKVIKEIPPKRLLDAFYSMQKFIGMIVDEKI